MLFSMNSLLQILYKIGWNQWNKSNDRNHTVLMKKGGKKITFIKIVRTKDTKKHLIPNDISEFWQIYICLPLSAIKNKIKAMLLVDYKIWNPNKLSSTREWKKKGINIRWKILICSRAWNFSSIPFINWLHFYLPTTIFIFQIGIS